MKKTIVFFLWATAIVLLTFNLSSCKPEEKIVEKQMIQFSPQELEEKNEAVYVTKTTEGRARTSLSLDFSRVKKPATLDDFQQHFHLPPVRQYKTGTCWCFSTISFLESELKRLGKTEVKLSEIYPVYWEYVEKARRFIREKGNSNLGEGSEPNSAIARIKDYGLVRASDYSGLLPGQTEHDHSTLFSEFKKYLQFCKDNEYWDEEKAVSYVKSILDKYLGKPPETIAVNGQTVTPKEYLEATLQLPLDDYVSVMSTKSIPFYTKGEYKVPDNWWHSQDYHNVPLDDYYQAILDALKKGYTVVLGGDVSEPGISGDNDIAIVPTYDIPRKLIDQDSREFRFSNRTSTDDHAIHLVGFKEGSPDTWFLIKDSGRGAHSGQFIGYYLYREDYLKLKMLIFLTHRDAVADLLRKFEQTD